LVHIIDHPLSTLTIGRLDMPERTTWKKMTSERTADPEMPIQKQFELNFVGTNGSGSM
jgi:hypothetical protein